MSTALAKPEQISQWEQREMIDTLKATVCRGATDAQFKMFIEVAKATGLNPWLKEIWFVPNVGVMAGRDGYLRVANDHPAFDGMETRVERDERGVPIKAVCTVWRKDRNHPVISEAYYDEYKKTSQVWQTYKSAMIQKVAEVMALKRSFAINGVVSEEEIGHDERGSAEAAQQVAKAKIEELNQKRLEAGEAQIIPPVAAETIAQNRSAGASQSGGSTPISIDSLADRKAQQEAEAAAALEEMHTDPKVTDPAKTAARPKRDDPGKAPLDPTMLQSFKEIKEKLREESGSDVCYYAVLKQFGYAKSNQIPTRDDGRAVHKSMRAALVRLREIRVNREELEAFRTSIKPVEVFWEICDGYDSETLLDAPPEVVQRFLDKLREVK